MQTRKSYCRVCHNYCALEVDVEDGRVTSVRGDATDPVYGGYTCIKGRQLPELLRHPARLLRPLRRRPDGSFEEIGREQALDEIAERVGAVVHEHGPRAVASYCGTHAFQNAAALAVSKAWHQGVGSESFYSSVTIDQPGKFIAMSRAGIWSAGSHGFEGADVVMVIGCNTIVSQYAPWGGIPPWSPVKALQDAKRRGMRLIAVDPRRTDVARRADLHLQVRPGEDPTLLAGMLRVILTEGLHDAAFCARWVEGLDALREAVDPFTLDYTARRSGVPAEQVEAAARLFAAGPRGIASTGTGPDMAPRANLTEHLVIALNVVCGRMRRAGEKVTNPGVLTPAPPRKAQPMAPWRAFGAGPRSRVRGLGQVIGEMPTAALSDEILEPGEGQVKALLCIGGNPVVAWPDQAKTVRAMQALDLLVCIDSRLSATSRMADYVLAPALCLERADVPVLTDTWYEKPYSHYATPVVPPPEGAEVVEEWELYTEIARRLGHTIRLGRSELPLDPPPDKETVLEHVVARSRVPLAKLREHEGGRVFPEIEDVVAPADPDCEARFQLAPDGVPEELAAVHGEPLDSRFSHRLISRRLRHVYNSSGRDVPAIRKRGTTNPAFMNPGDIDALGIASGDLVEIASDHASILGVAEAASDVPPGVVSMAHAWGDPAAHDKDVREIGSSTNRLVSNERDFDPISGMARQSAIPVNVRPAPEL
ncbi:MAG: molybdopterin-containing oxidoreductase family protein [Myxococcota bacterium]